MIIIFHHHIVINTGNVRDASQCVSKTLKKLVRRDVEVAFMSYYDVSVW